MVLLGRGGGEREREREKRRGKDFCSNYENDETTRGPTPHAIKDIVDMDFVFSTKSSAGL